MKMYGKEECIGLPLTPTNFKSILSLLAVSSMFMENGITSIKMNHSVNHNEYIMLPIISHNL